MSGRAIKSEPDGNLNLLPSKTDTEKILRQFGVGAAPVDFANRGVLDLEVGPRLTKAEVGDPNINVLLYSALRERTDNHSGCWALTEDLPSMLEINDWSAHISQISTFQSIIQETKDPAIAVQVLLSRLYQMGYYDWSKEFNVQYPITMVHAIDMLIPTRWIGLFMVLCLVGLHFALCLVTLLLFVSWTKTSVLGNSWQAVAQIISPQTRDILELADVLSDREVKKVVKATGRDEEVYTVSRSAQYGRMQIQPFSAK